MKIGKFARRGGLSIVGLCLGLFLIPLVFQKSSEGSFSSAWAQCMDISDSPMDTRVQAAPPNIMFVLDNSGSMDWEFMTPESEGKFDDHEYVFDDPGDNTYTSGGNSDILSSSDRLYWKSQWSEYNRIYYNPHSEYLPWPNLSDANLTQPRSNPANANPTFDLTQEYVSISNYILVDNSDSGFTVSDESQWGISSYSYDIGSDYRYNNTLYSDAWAKWTPDLPGAQTYGVYVWFRDLWERHDDVTYTIYHDGTTSTVSGISHYAGDGLGDQWNKLGDFDFSADGTEYVRIEALDIDNDCCDYSADAVAFALPAVSVKRAHYYVQDSNGTTYLVNFGSDDDLDGVPDREYYQVNDSDGDDRIDPGELVATTFAVVPDAIKPKNYDDSGAFLSYKTDEEDLQNFANWYSFYRRRELNAKAAVSRAIVDLSGVRIGLYTINSGVRQPVRPIKVASNAIIVDNMDSGYEESGTWGESSAEDYNPEYEGSSRYTNSPNSATWTPTIPSAGTYRVYAWWDWWSTRDTNALYTVNYDGGSHSQRVNQQENYSQWTLLGEFDFAAGTSGSVTVTRDGSSTGSSTSADAVKFESVSGSFSQDETDELLTQLYSIDSDGNTPLRNSLEDIGQYYDQDDGNDGNLGSSPYDSVTDGGPCQQSFAIVMSDGYWNGGDPGVGNQDDSVGTPYGDSYSDTLADVAMKYYQNDLASGLSDEVPLNACDSASHQHMVTYTVSFGVTGTIDPDQYHWCLLEGGQPQWTDPESDDAHKIDDLYHAAVNGRGKFFSASDPEELVESLLSIMSNIESRIASGASVSVNAQELQAGTVIYQSVYSSDDWTGDLRAYPVDPQTGEILSEEQNILWKASDELQMTPWSDRLIATYNGMAQGLPFVYDQLTSGQQASLDANATVAENLVNYIRGDEISPFRSRSRKLGDLVNSIPYLFKDTIYIGGNDGMLHAFNAQDGTERFAYVPNLVIPKLKELAVPEYQHEFFVDQTVTIKEGVNNSTLLVGGLGKGGKGYFALDVTDADSLSMDSNSTADVADMVLWEYPKEGVTDDDLGLSLSRTSIVRSNSDSSPWITVFGNGYDSLNGTAVLYILDTQGDVVKKIDTQSGGCNGLSTPALVDTDFDYRVDYVYAGDLNGNLWKFDLTNSSVQNWDSAFFDPDNVTKPKPLFKASNQPITIKPDVMFHCEEEGYLVNFATGKYLGISDRTDNSTQTVYGIWDYGDDADDGEYVGTFDTSTGTLSDTPLSSNATLLEQTQVAWTSVSGVDLRVTSDNEPSWSTKVDSDDDSDVDSDKKQLPNPIGHVGWYFNLPGLGLSPNQDAGERVIDDIMIRDQMLIATSFEPSNSPCSGGGNSVVNELVACSGSRPSEARFDIDDDGDIDADDLVTVDGTPIPPTGRQYTGRLHPPVILGKDPERETKIFSTSAATTVTMDETAEQYGLVYWREVTEE